MPNRMSSRRESAISSNRVRWRATPTNCQNADENFETLEELPDARDRWHHAQEQLSTARVEVGQVGEKLEAARRDVRHAETAREDNSDRLRQTQEQLARRSSQSDQFDAAIAESQREIQEASVRREGEGDSRKQLDERIEATGEKLAATSTALEQADPNTAFSRTIMPSSSRDVRPKSSGNISRIAC